MCMLGEVTGGPTDDQRSTRSYADSACVEQAVVREPSAPSPLHRRSSAEACATVDRPRPARYNAAHGQSCAVYGRSRAPASWHHYSIISQTHALAGASRFDVSVDCGAGARPKPRLELQETQVRRRSEDRTRDLVLQKERKQETTIHQQNSRRGQELRSGFPPSPCAMLAHASCFLASRRQRRQHD